MLMSFWLWRHVSAYQTDVVRSFYCLYQRYPWKVPVYLNSPWVGFCNRVMYGNVRLKLHVTDHNGGHTLASDHYTSSITGDSARFLASRVTLEQDFLSFVPDIHHYTITSYPTHLSRVPENTIRPISSRLFPVHRLCRPAIWQHIGAFVVKSTSLNEPRNKQFLWSMRDYKETRLVKIQRNVIEWPTLLSKTNFGC
jgi:hypothetical protein